MMLEKDVIVCGQYATGYKDGEPVPASHLYRDDALYEGPFYPPQNELSGNTVSVVNIWSHNYFHWLLENLTQLVLLKDEIDHILVPHWYPEFVFESIEYLGLTDKIENWIGTSTKVNLLHAGPQRINGYSQEPGLNAMLAVFRRKSSGPKRVYVSRTDAGSRRVLNEATYLSELSTYRKVLPSKLSLLEQAEMFGNATHIIGPHGAGLANMIWPRSCKVTELVGEYKNPCYEKLAVTLGHEYEMVQCTPMGTDMFAEVQNGS